MPEGRVQLEAGVPDWLQQREKPALISRLAIRSKVYRSKVHECGLCGLEVINLYLSNKIPEINDGYHCNPLHTKLMTGLHTHTKQWAHIAT